VFNDEHPRPWRRGTKARMGRMTLGVAALAAVALVAGCGSSSDASGSAAGSAPDLGTVTVGVQPGNSQLSAFVAEAKGFFEKRGLDVKFTYLTGGGAEAVAAIQGGSMQIASSNIVSSIQGAQKGIKTPCFAGHVGFNTKGNAYTVVGSPGVKDAQELAGKNIAVVSTGSANEVLADAYLDSNGVDYHSVKFVTAAAAAMPAVLTSKNAAAGLINDPYGTNYLKSGGTLLERNPGRLIGQPLFSCWVAAQGWPAAHPEQAKAYLDGLDEAITYLKDHTKDADKAAAKYAKVPAASLDALTPWKFTTTMSEDDINKWLAAGVKYGVLQPQVTMSDVYAPAAR
jgi:NitT/TauT family transport system substrate-binding protein